MEIRGRVLARNATLNFFGQLVPLSIGLLTVPFIIRVLGTDRFGLLSLIWALLSYFGIFDLGLGRATTKFIAEDLGRGQTERLSSIFWSSITIQALLGVVGGALLAIAIPSMIQRFLHVPAELQLEAQLSFLFLAGAMPIIIVSNSLRGVLEAAQRFDLVNTVKAITNIVIFISPLVGTLIGFDLSGITLMLIAVWLLSLSAFLVLCLRIFPVLRRPVLAPGGTMLPLVRFGSWIMVSNTLYPIFTYLDRFFIGALLTIPAVAYYSAPYDAITRLWIVPTSVIATLFPAFSMLGARGAHEKSAEFLAYAVKYLFMVMGPLVAVLIVFAHEIIVVWLGAEFARASTLAFQVLAFGVLINSVAYIPYSFLQGSGRTDIPAKFHLMEIIPYIVVLWLFIERFGVAGAAFAWTLRICVDALLLFTAAHRMNHRSVFDGESAILRAVFATLMFGGATYAIQLIHVTLGIQLILAGAFFVVFTLLAWRFVLNATDKKLVGALLTGNRSA